MDADESNQQTTGDEREAEEQPQVSKLPVNRRVSVTGEFIGDELMQLNTSFKFSLSKARDGLQKKHLKQAAVLHKQQQNDLSHVTNDGSAANGVTFGKGKHSVPAGMGRGPTIDISAANVNVTSPLRHHND